MCSAAPGGKGENTHRSARVYQTESFDTREHSISSH